MTAPGSQDAAEECQSFAASTRIEAVQATPMSMDALPHLMLTPGRRVSSFTDQFMLCDGRAWSKEKWTGDYPPGLIATVFRTWHRRDRSRPLHMAVVGSMGVVSEIACENAMTGDRMLHVDNAEDLIVQLERSDVLGVPKRYVARGVTTREVYSMPMIDHLTRVRVEQNGQWLLTGQVQSRESALGIFFVLARAVSLGRLFPGYPLHVFGLIDQVGPLKLTRQQQWQVVTLLVMMRVTEFHRGVDSD